MHQTIDLEDGYMGSGKLLKRAVNKYGIENFTKKILHVFETEDDMRSKEAELVNEEYVARDDTYNLCQGGKGGFGYINENRLGIRPFTESEMTKGRKVVNQLYKNSASFRIKRSENMSKAFKKSGFKHDGFKGKTHSDEVKSKIGKANSLHQRGSKNSQYGVRWVNKNGLVKKIDKESLEMFLTDGWKRGKKI